MNDLDFKLVPRELSEEELRSVNEYLTFDSMRIDKLRSKGILSRIEEMKAEGVDTENLCRFRNIDELPDSEMNQFIDEYNETKRFNSNAHFVAYDVPNGVFVTSVNMFYMDFDLIKIVEQFFIKNDGTTVKGNIDEIDSLNIL